MRTPGRGRQARLRDQGLHDRLPRLRCAEGGEGERTGDDGTVRGGGCGPRPLWPWREGARDSQVRSRGRDDALGAVRGERRLALALGRESGGAAGPVPAFPAQYGGRRRLRYRGSRRRLGHNPLPWNNDPWKLPSAGNSGGTAARISVSHTGSRTVPRHQCPNADHGPGQTCIRPTHTHYCAGGLFARNKHHVTIPRAHAASCCSLRVRAPAPPGWKLASTARREPLSGRDVETLPDRG